MKQISTIVIALLLGKVNAVNINKEYMLLSIEAENGNSLGAYQEAYEA
jgi:hypothetical protein